MPLSPTCLINRQNLAPRSEFAQLAVSPPQRRGFRAAGSARRIGANPRCHEVHPQEANNWARNEETLQRSSESSALVGKLRGDGGHQQVGIFRIPGGQTAWWTLAVSLWPSADCSQTHTWRSWQVLPQGRFMECSKPELLQVHRCRHARIERLTDYHIAWSRTKRKHHRQKDPGDVAEDKYPHFMFGRVLARANCRAEGSFGCEPSVWDALQWGWTGQEPGGKS